VYATVQSHREEYPIGAEEREGGTGG